MERPYFSLTAGGPFHRVLGHLQLRPPRHWWLAIFVWLPLVVPEALRFVSGSPADSMVFDLSLHVRFLIGLPLLLSAETIIEGSANSAIRSLHRGQLCDRDVLDRIVARGEWLRGWWVPEAIILGIALLGGQLVLWQVLASTGWISGGVEVATWTIPRIWYAVIALPLFQFVMFRWLWRWAIWCVMLVRISRLPLTPLATHPDFAGGLAGLARPMSGFAGFTLAMGCVLASAWGTRVLEGQVTLQALLPGLATFLLTATALATAPLLMFSGHLFRSRRVALAEYGDFARKYMLQFHEKWILPHAIDRSPLGQPDIQSMNDLGAAFQIISKSRVFVFGPRNVLAIWFAGMIPMVPLFASALTVEQILKRIIMTVVGGLPF